MKNGEKEIANEVYLDKALKILNNRKSSKLIEDESGNMMKISDGKDTVTIVKRNNVKCVGLDGTNFNIIVGSSGGESYILKNKVLGIEYKLLEKELDDGICIRYLYEKTGEDILIAVYLNNGPEFEPIQYYRYLKDQNTYMKLTNSDLIDLPVQELVTYAEEELSHWQENNDENSNDTESTNEDKGEAQKGYENNLEFSIEAEEKSLPANIEEYTVDYSNRESATSKNDGYYTKDSNTIKNDIENNDSFSTDNEIEDDEDPFLEEDMDLIGDYCDSFDIIVDGLSIDGDMQKTDIINDINDLIENKDENASDMADAIQCINEVYEVILSELTQEEFEESHQTDYNDIEK